MCEIFAYLNYNVNRERRYILEVLFNGLRRLEYRGYDSTGISIDFALLPLNSGASVFTTFSRPLGFRKIESLVKFVYESSELNLEESFTVHAGIAHTRWVTHREPAPRNSHPQTSGPENDFVVVHNGVITNYEVCNTDAEVISKLAKYVFDKANEGEGEHIISFSEVVLEVMRHLNGAYALIFKSRHYPNELVTCKRGGPLLLGVKNRQPKELFFSSDTNALVEHTKKVLVVEDGCSCEVAASFHFFFFCGA
ncbi:hypothetical protein Cgig2_002064 [Carnegiea gigantea]|uniref:glutamine--fructose-6-phosphate transaminase (isomerizing) n=1 Tax=Carnegiea gigantea TaxID=171969 RepID=A0A9Q1JKE8_9CARY|nr:hypothetical protein Cgig2_002064 [Carnegiea gigantea]